MVLMVKLVLLGLCIPPSGSEIPSIVSEGDPGASGAADHLFDPPCESGDACVDAVVVRAATASAPADHPGEEPATRRLLANQGPARVPLTRMYDLYGLSCD